jgi:two-component system, LytTR family, sensor kinase
VVTPSENDNAWPELWRPRTWAFITLGVLALFVLEFIGTAAEWRNARLPWPLELPFVWQLTGHLAFLAVLPPLLQVFLRAPLTGARWPLHLALSLGTMVVLAFVQMALMWVLRVAVYAALGWGPYDVGSIGWVIPMELVRALPAYLGVLGLFTLAKTLRAQQRRALLEARLERELAEARLTLLKRQLSPHFLFNALNAIRVAIGEDPRAADRMLGHLAEFLRLALRHALDQEVTLATELAFVDAYVAIMKARFEERLEVSVDVPTAVRDALVPHLVLQPLVENAIVHALDVPGSGRALVEVLAHEAAPTLTVRVRDNGKTDPSEARPGHGVGLSNTRARLEALHQARARLVAQPRPEGGFEVQVDLPLRRGAPAT